MKIERVVVGNLETNCYILIKEKNALVIDPGDEIEKIQEKTKDYNILGVLITHRHFDHIGALNYFNKHKIYDFSNIEEKQYKIENFTFDIIKNPGHTTDSISFYFKEINCLFCGDFIFYENIGRCDLPTGDFNTMIESINKIKKYPNNMKIYPGHGIETNLKHEIENNIYFKV